MSLYKDVKYTMIAGAVGLAGILGLGASGVLRNNPIYRTGGHAYEAMAQPKPEAKMVYSDSRAASIPATYPATTQCESDSLEVICSEFVSEPKEHSDARYIPSRVPTEVLRSEERQESGASFYVLKRQDSRGIDLFDKLEDVIYRMAHDDRRALRDTYAHLHPLTIQGYRFNPNMHTGPHARGTSRNIVREMVKTFSIDEQRTLAGILGQAGYQVNSTEELKSAVSDLYAIFSRNIREDKDYHAAMLAKQVGAALLIGYGVSHIGKGHNHPQPNPNPDGIQGGHITGGYRTDSR